MSSRSLPLLATCPHEEGVLENAPCGSEWKHVRGCAIHDRCTRGPNNGKVASCATCLDNPSRKAAPITLTPPSPLACAFRGRWTRETVPGVTKTKGQPIPVFSCKLHGTCVTELPIGKSPPLWCKICPDRKTPEQLTRVLFEFPHGLGDCVQFAVVLRHLAASRPDWVIDVRTHPGKMSAFRHAARRVISFGDDSADHSHSSVVKASFVDRPDATKTLACLQAYRLAVKPELMPYRVEITSSDRAAAESLYALAEIDPSKTVVIHYQGNSLPAKKNLTDRQVLPLADECGRRGLTLVVLDFDLKAGRDITSHRAVLPVQTAEFMDAARIAALKSLAFRWVGIDSGPGHVGGAVATPGVVVWTGHHPLRFYDSGMPHVLHLVPPHLDKLPGHDAERFKAYRSKPYLQLDKELPTHVLGDS